jgi:hypothetical protein
MIATAKVTAEADALRDPSFIADVKVSLALGGHLFDRVDKLERRRPDLARTKSPHSDRLSIGLDFGLKTAKRITAITLERPLEITLCLVD